jgi:SAM domain (Sterile alpha motif)
MTIEEWLDRLNLPQYIIKLKSQNLRRIQDLSNIDEGILQDQFEVTDMIHLKRILWMMEGKREMIDDFQYQTLHQCRSIISNYVKKNTNLEKILVNIPNQTLTAFQLRDILTSNSKIDEIISKIKDRVQSSILTKRGRTTIIDETEDTKKKEELNALKYPSYDIIKLFKEMDLEKCIPKLKEHYLLEPSIFWNLTESDFETMLEIKVYG